jgi:hypothetical protein
MRILCCDRGDRGGRRSAASRRERVLMSEVGLVQLVGRVPRPRQRRRLGWHAQVRQDSLD